MTKPFDPVKFAEGLHDYISQVVAPIFKEIEALKQREAKTLADSYKGAWLPGRYERGQFVTHRGAWWICIETGDGKPGGSEHWRMIDKSARE